MFSATEALISCGEQAERARTRLSGSAVQAAVYVKPREEWVGQPAGKGECTGGSHISCFSTIILIRPTH